ncbi:MAG: 4-(cytidine 5'-diphospho)-2-C-methyl-D-erythritol kinase [Thermomicrobium sp.]|nr:4-(cytidine 5'-diphospho)-2-C-methyl-D-erythritol kinase [Thermomicrobium sp.]MDW8059772.1 4-(cytidine 5'-diphospho)-2-C-methyl-D-erythritol kinase [Thermomicrobium sp.]
MSHLRLVVRHPIEVPAPAKLNLGLEVLGRRPDGYHEIVTILQTVDLCDELAFAPAPSLSYEPLEGIDDDLLCRALRCLAARGVDVAARIHLTKRIPVAAGLGGGSSDAGTLLGLALRAGLDRPLVEEVARELGSDVPFFLDGGTAIARGRGTELEPLPMPDGYFVVAVPQLALPHKTRQLYAALTPADYSDGRATERQAERLRAGRGLDPTSIRNAFLRPLYRFPEVRRLLAAFEAAGARWVWPSGAGPALFTWCAERAEAQAIAGRLERAGERPFLVAPYQPRWESFRSAFALHPSRS